MPFPLKSLVLGIYSLGFVLVLLVRSKATRSFWICEQKHDYLLSEKFDFAFLHKRGQQDTCGKPPK